MLWENVTLADFITSTEAKNHLGVSGSGDDTLIDALIDGACRAVRNYCKRALIAVSTSGTYTEYLDGDGESSEIYLEEYPVTSITSLHDDPDWDYGTDELLDPVGTGDENYQWYESGRIQLIGMVFQAGKKNIKVVYKAGFATAPDDVKLATKILVAAMYHRAKQGGEGIASENLGGYSVAYEGDLSAIVKTLLAPYKRIVI